MRARESWSQAGAGRENGEKSVVNAGKRAPLWCRQARMLLFYIITTRTGGGGEGNDVLL